jgi:hypothetical protein
MGDQCVTIAKLTKLSSHLDTRQTVVEGLVDMGERCVEMVKVSLTAFADRDVAQARALHGLDDLVDTANRQVFHEVLGYVNDAEALEWGMTDHSCAVLRADRTTPSTSASRPRSSSPASSRSSRTHRTIHVRLPAFTTPPPSFTSPMPIAGGAAATIAAHRQTTEGWDG